jgi:hypothetical protein
MASTDADGHRHVAVDERDEETRRSADDQVAELHRQPEHVEEPVRQPVDGAEDADLTRPMVGWLAPRIAAARISSPAPETHNHQKFTARVVHEDRRGHLAAASARFASRR